MDKISYDQIILDAVKVHKQLLFLLESKTDYELIMESTRLIKEKLPRFKYFKFCINDKFKPGTVNVLAISCHHETFGTFNDIKHTRDLSAKYYYLERDCSKIFYVAELLDKND